jgi:hypothetical protein
MSRASAVALTGPAPHPSPASAPSRPSVTRRTARRSHSRAGRVPRSVNALALAAGERTRTSHREREARPSGPQGHSRHVRRVRLCRTVVARVRDLAARNEPRGVAQRHLAIFCLFAGTTAGPLQAETWGTRGWRVGSTWPDTSGSRARIKPGSTAGTTFGCRLPAWPDCYSSRMRKRAHRRPRSSGRVHSERSLRWLRDGRSCK